MKDSHVSLVDQRWIKRALSEQNSNCFNVIKGTIMGNLKDGGLVVCLIPFYYMIQVRITLKSSDFSVKIV